MPFALLITFSLIEFDACLFDDLRPLVALGADERRELTRCITYRLATQSDEPVLRVPAVQHPDDITVEPRDDVRRRARRRQPAEPADDLESRISQFRHRRQFRR